MPRLILTATAMIIGAVPATAAAVPIHVHERVPIVREVVTQKVIAGDPMPTTALIRDTKRVETVVHVAPRDRDDDGLADATADPCVGVCAPPAPVYVEASEPASSSYTAPASAPSAVPSYITECESGGDYGAYNPASGATGAYQIIPSTAAAYGCDLSTPAGQDACAGEIYAAEGTSAWDCG